MAKTLVTYFLKTAVYQGPGSRAMLPDLLGGLGGKRAVLFTDEGLVKAGVADQVTRVMNSAFRGTTTEIVGVFNKIPQDAEAGVIDEAVRYFRELHADAMIALGGGSVLDSVKCIKYVIHKGADHILDLMPANFAFESFPKAQLIPIPHVALPTTAGTGAEVSPAAVVYNQAEKVKGDLAHPFIGADVAILDPELSVSLPKTLTAATAFDALTHAIEGIASPGANCFVDAFGFEAIRRIWRNLPRVIESPGDINGRNELLGAACTAILSFIYAIPGAYPVHNFAHAMGAHHRVHHGTANAVFLTYAMEEIPGLYRPRAKDLAAALDIPSEGKGEDRLLEDCIEAIKGLRQSCNLPGDFKGLELGATELNTLTMAVMRDPIGIIYPLPEGTIRNVLQRVV